MSNSMMVTASSADVQVVAAASRILVDVQTRHFDTAGQSRRDHACAGLSVSEASRLYVLLGKAIAIAVEAEPRQGRNQLALVRIRGRNQNGPAVHPQKSAKLACLPSTGSSAAITENGFVVSATKRFEPVGRR
jgi:hypothetical protein